MIRFNNISRDAFFRYLKKQYYTQILTPLDGMWENAFVRNATHWKITYHQTTAGCFCIDTHRNLLLFHVFTDFQPYAADIFDDLLSRNLMDYASVSTGDPLFLSLCMDRNNGVTSHTLLFEDHRTVSPDPALAASTRIIPASFEEEKAILHFYRTNLDVSANFKSFIIQLIDLQQLYLIKQADSIIATGECRISRSQPSYADIGMVVAQTHRNRGIGRHVLCQLKQTCRTLNKTPICSTEFDNIASRKAIQAAGFVSRHRILTIRF